MNGRGFGPGGKFFGRRLAQAYGARATIDAATMATTREATETQRFVVHGSPLFHGVEDIFQDFGVSVRADPAVWEAERLIAVSTFRAPVLLKQILAKQ